MLRSPPLGVTDEVMNLWLSMQPMSVELFEKYWDKIEPSRPLFDFESMVAEEWQEDGWRYFGTRHKVTG